MLLPLFLLLGALALAFGAPLLLAGGRWQVFRPALALGLWFSAFVLGVGLACSAFVASVVVAVDASTTPGSFGASLLAWGAVVVAAGVIAIATGASDPLVDSYRENLRRLTPVATSREDRGAFTLVRFESDDPVAVAVPGRPAEILVSSALERALTTAQLHAVLAHEYAHLRGRHGLLVRLAELNEACLPGFVPAGRSLRKATLMLVELVADDVAARQAGSAQLTVALERLAEASGEAGFLARAERLRAIAPQRPDSAALPAAVRV